MIRLKLGNAVLDEFVVVDVYIKNGLTRERGVAKNYDLVTNAWVSFRLQSQANRT